MEEHQMIFPGMVVLAGVSGGSDSIAMLHILASLRNQMNFKLYALHVNHGIRGSEADRDQETALETAKLLEVPCQAVKRQVPSLSEEWKTGEEETGRKVRREAFEEEIKRLSAPGEGRIALAHNQDDLAETVIHHLARGTGLRGIGSMRPCSGKLIRPVLCLNKEETISYLQEEGLRFEEDRTNAEDAYTRNRIRHYVIPCLKEMVNPQTSVHLAAAAGFCADASDYLIRTGQRLLQDCPKYGGGYLLDGHFSEADPVEKEYMILAALEKLSSTQKDLGSVHVRAVLQLAGNRTKGSHLDLPYGLFAERTPEGILLAPSGTAYSSPKKDTETGVYPETPLRISESGSICTTEYGGFCFKTRIFPFSGQNIEEKKYTKWFDYDRIKNDFHIRQKKTGDYMIVTENGVRKKLRRVMIDDKIPLRIRDTLPVVAEGEKIIWIAGFRPCAEYRISPSTETVLEISCDPPFHTDNALGG